jgi:CRISPR-associated endonuclease/helicase Cas3
LPRTSDTFSLLLNPIWGGSISRLKADEVIQSFQLDPAASRGALRLLADVTTPVIGEGRKPRPAQTAVAEARVEPGSIIVVEAETGSGKTEAALLHFAKLFKAGDVDGLYFALPTRAAAVQIHRPVCDVWWRPRDRSLFGAD